MADFDGAYGALVVGTGLAESAVAASLAQGGVSVLHVDNNDFYGADAAGFSLQGCAQWAEGVLAKQRAGPGAAQPAAAARDEAWLALAASRLELAAADDLVLVRVGGDAVEVHGVGVLRDCDEIKNAAVEAMCAEAPVDSGEADDVRSLSAAAAAAAVERAGAAVARAAADAAERDVSKRAKRFNIDLDARAIYAAGGSVDGILAAGVAHYLEFDSIQKLLLVERSAEGFAAPLVVPCSKKEIFASTALVPTEKRRLMRLLQFAADWGEADVATLNERGLTASRALRRPQNKRASEGHELEEGLTFSQLLDKYELSDRLAKVVAFSMAFVDGPVDSTPAAAGLQALYRHLHALGGRMRGCETALLAPLYGSAELPQAFCRACAVHGGVYALRRAPAALVADERTQRVVGAIFAGEGETAQFVRLDHVVVAGDYVAAAAVRRRVVRRVAVVLRPRDVRCCVVFEPAAGGAAVRCLVLDESAKATPDGLVDVAVAYLTTVSDAENVGKTVEDLAAASETLGARVLWHVDFSWPLHDDVSTRLYDNAAVVRRKAPSLDMAPQLEEAAAALCHLLGLEARLFRAARDADGDGDGDGEAGQGRPRVVDEEEDDLAALLDSLQAAPQ
ncbi:GDP dissociation inhibitor-domain-containing protein [Pelagophyceae sp. CCMP2097]|nr:GDP dissociation inhibitor-domain-containing protein [Pelagophyceae sp. CCMP2097]